MADVELRWAVTEDFEALLGMKSPHTCRAVAAVYEGQVAAIAGFTLGGVLSVAFFDMRRDLKVGKMTIWRNAKKMAEMILPGFTVVAAASESYPNSGKFLEMMGFVKYGEYYVRYGE